MATTPATPNTSPALIRSGGIIGTPVTLTTQVSDRTANQTPTTIYDPTVHGQGNGALVEELVVMPQGVNVASVLLLYVLPVSAITPKWLFFREIALPAVTAVSASGVVTGYPVTMTLPKVLAPIAVNDPAGNPQRGLRINNAGYSWGVALGTAIAAGVNVYLIGGEY